MKSRHWLGKVIQSFPPSLRSISRFPRSRCYNFNFLKHSTVYYIQISTMPLKVYSEHITFGCFFMCPRFLPFFHLLWGRAWGATHNITSAIMKWRKLFRSHNYFRCNFKCFNSLRFCGRVTQVKMRGKVDLICFDAARFQCHHMMIWWWCEITQNHVMFFIAKEPKDQNITNCR